MLDKVYHFLKLPHKVFLLIELIGIFVVIPLLIYFFHPSYILPILWGIAFVCGIILYKDKTFDRQRFWGVSSVYTHHKLIWIPFVIVTFVLFILVYFFAHQLLFSLLIYHPMVWFLIMLLYPLVSVYPQELLYRTFFFYRYGTLFPNKIYMIVLNGFLFGYLHIVFHNIIAVVLTIGGGILFAWMYERTRSTAFIFIAHSLYGMMLFTLGLGEFFDYGTLKTILEFMS